MYCPKCGTENAENARICSSCGCVLSASGPAAPAGTPLEIRTSRLAIAALVLGILSLFTLGLTILPAIILGIAALVAISRSGGRLTGTAFAVVGMVVPVFSLFFVAILMAILTPALTRTRLQAKRVVCLSNVKELSLAWVLYANENDGRIINGAAGRDRASDGSGFEEAWVGRDWAPGYKSGEQLPEQEQQSAIRAGLLFPFCRMTNVYRCPVGVAGQSRTYAIVDAMNGVPREGTEQPGLYIKRMREIGRPSYRAVFIDQGWAAPESFTVYYDKGQWWSPPPVTHDSSTVVSFVDGHVDVWRWKASETVKMARRPGPDYDEAPVAPETPDGRDDLKRLQAAVWGQVGYETAPYRY